MRLPLLATLILLIIDVAIDFYLWRRIKRSCKNPLWAKLQAYSAIILNICLLVVICIPKKKGGDAGLEFLMWSLYAYFSVYVPKYIFCIFDFISAIPKLFRHKRLNWLSACGGVLAVLIFVAMWWGALINRYNIDVREVEIIIPDLPESFDGYTIAQISDMHVGTYGADTSYVAKVVECVNSLDADVITFTGDIVNRKTTELVPFIKPLSRLQARDGVYSILGNHDYGDYYTWPSPEAKQKNMSDLINYQKQMGWHMLNNESDFVYRQGDSIAIVGVENVGDPPFNTYGDLDIAYPALDDEVVKILLSHNPAHWNDDIKDSPDKNIALTLSGHTHAMQISAFGLSPAAWRYPTWGGLYADEDGHQLYVNIGIGEVGVPARIGATPEITLITLRRK
ncbi:MAG: metallophosphoesterase [Muribaculaceae bacterium]|nr:metallophosphoesterase [Muribaculaceae bacterium]